MSEIIGKSYNPYAMPSGAGGLLSGFQMGRQIAKEKGLASGFAKIQAGDDSGWKEAFDADPVATMNAWNNQQKLKQLQAQKEFNTTNERKNAEYLISQGYEPKEAINMAFKVNQAQNLSPIDKKRMENIATKIDENIAKAQERKALYERADQLLDRGVETGGTKGYLSKKYLPTAFMSPELAEFESLVSKLVPQQRPAGSGTTSDRDMAIYEKATIGLDKDKETNKNILALGKAMSENDIAYEELRASWLNQGGNLTDFDRAWRKYAEDQRIYNDDGTINKKRINPYDYFMGNTLKQEQPKKSKYVIEEVIE